MHGPCPVCASPFTAYVRDVPTIRTKCEIALYTCLDCRSFWNPSGYKETEDVLRNDLRWGLSVVERNRNAANRLFDQFEQMGIQSNSVAEIGCGIGTLLTVARERGKQTIGFDVNPFAIEYAKGTNKLDARAEFWSEFTEMPKVDLYLCISVLEHIDQPRPLIKSLCAAAKRDDAVLFISVPFVDRPQWDYILDPDPAKPETPFFDNDVHVVHFSTSGLIGAVKEFGLADADLHCGVLWHGVLAGVSQPA